MSKIHNFSAGPGILPVEVLKQASEACINFDNMNLSLLEISHRSKNYEKVMEEARSLVKEVGIAAVPGSSFYREARFGYKRLRFAFCKKMETLERAAELLGKTSEIFASQR